MRWPRDFRLMGILLLFLAAVIYFVLIGGVIPLLSRYRDYPSVRVLLALISGGHLEEPFQETGILC